MYKIYEVPGVVIVMESEDALFITISLFIHST